MQRRLLPCSNFRSSNRGVTVPYIKKKLIASLDLLSQLILNFSVLRERPPKVLKRNRRKSVLTLIGRKLPYICGIVLVLRHSTGSNTIGSMSAKRHLKGGEHGIGSLT